MIRRGTYRDIPDAIRLGILEYEEERAAECGIELYPASVAVSLERIIDGTVPGEFFVAVWDGLHVVGMIIVQYAVFAGNLRQPMAIEAGWFVEKPHRGLGLGKRLLDAAEHAVASRGLAKVLNLGAPYLPEYSAALIQKYQSWGYTPFEVYCYKEIKRGEK